MSGPAEDFRLGPWNVYPRLNRIRDDRGFRQLEPRVMRTLVALALKRGEVIRRSEFLDQIWGDIVVTDDSLTRSISDLRKALDDDRLKPVMIETIRSVGYRLVCPVLPLKQTHAAPTSVPARPFKPETRHPPTFPSFRVVVATVGVVLSVLATVRVLQAPLEAPRTKKG